MLRGDVQSLNLPSIVQNLAGDEKTGTLTLTQDEARAHVWFERGVIRLVGFDGGVGPSVLAGLLALGRVPLEEITTPPRRRLGKRRTTGVLPRILKKYRLGRQDVAEALAHQMTEHLCEVMAWTEASYEFAEGEPRNDCFDVGQLQAEVQLSPEAAVMEAIRRGDEWQEIRKVVGRATDILVRQWDELDPEVEPTIARVFAEVDGTHTIREICDRTRLGAFAVYKALATLMREGGIAALTRGRAADWAREAAGDQDWDAVLRYGDFVLSHEPHHAEVLELVAKAHDARGTVRDAVARYRELGTLLAEGQDPEAALAPFRRIVELAPEDLLAHERLLELLLTLGRQEDALDAIEGMTEAAQRAGLPDKLAAVYDRLIDSIGEDETLLSALADLERGLGKTVEAIDLYQRMLRPAMQRGDDAHALKLCETILQLDPEQDQAIKTRDRLRSGIEQKARERRRLRRAMVPLAALILALAAVGVHELLARRDLAGRRPEMLRATLDARHGDVIEMYDAFVASWPLSFAAWELRADRREIEPMFVGALEAESQKLRGEGDLLGAVEVVRQATQVELRSDLAIDVGARLRALEVELAEAEAEAALAVGGLARRIRNQDSVAAGELADLRDPLAIRGLRACLDDESEAVRRGAVLALGEIEGTASLHALVLALANPEAGVRDLASQRLAQRCGVDLGDDRLAWDRWVRLHDPALAELRVQPTVEITRRTDGARAVRWSLVSLEQEPRDLVMRDPGASLRVDGPAGPVDVGVRPSGARRVTLYPDESLSGSFDLKELGERVQAGIYRVEWRAFVVLEGVEHELVASPVFVEVD